MDHTTLFFTIRVSNIIKETFHFFLAIHNWQKKKMAFLSQWTCRAASV